VDLPHDGGVHMEGESHGLQPSGRWRVAGKQVGNIVGHAGGDGACSTVV
jgi:hypothetical protein